MGQSINIKIKQSIIIIFTFHQLPKQSGRISATSSTTFKLQFNNIIKLKQQITTHEIEAKDKV
jgi:hypothetical protein